MGYFVVEHTPLYLARFLLSFAYAILILYIVFRESERMLLLGVMALLFLCQIKSLAA